MSISYQQKVTNKINVAKGEILLKFLGKHFRCIGSDRMDTVMYTEDRSSFNSHKLSFLFECQCHSWEAHSTTCHERPQDFLRTPNLSIRCQHGQYRYQCWVTKADKLCRCILGISYNIKDKIFDILTGPTSTISIVKINYFHMSTATSIFTPLLKKRG